MKLSLMLMVYNTAHLLKRTLRTLENQGVDDFELLIIDDNSEDDVQAACASSDLPIRYFRLEHDMGMRGNTASINHGLSVAEGDIVMWSTPEVMLKPGTLAAIVNELSQDGDRKFVTVPSHGLTSEIQLEIDTVNWVADLSGIDTLVDKSNDDFTHRWFNLNFYPDGDINKPHKGSYGNNQTVAVNREAWLRTVGKFPLFLDYGSDDPWVSGKRKTLGYKDVTMWDHDAYHQWHPKAQYWMAYGNAPNWNRYGHTMSNLANDPEVPLGGTCEIWDHGSHEQLTPAEIEGELSLAPLVNMTGFARR